MRLLLRVCDAPAGKHFPFFSILSFGEHQIQQPYQHQDHYLEYVLILQHQTEVFFSIFSSSFNTFCLYTNIARTVPLPLLLYSHNFPFPFSVALYLQKVTSSRDKRFVVVLSLFLEYLGTHSLIPNEKQAKHQPTSLCQVVITQVKPQKEKQNLRMLTGADSSNCRMWTPYSTLYLGFLLIKAWRIANNIWLFWSSCQWIT